MKDFISLYFFKTTNIILFIILAKKGMIVPIYYILSDYFW